MGNLQEAEYRRREDQLRRGKDEEFQEIKSDLMQKLKLMKIRGFESFENFLHRHHLRRSRIEENNLKMLKREYKQLQHQVLTKLLEIKYFHAQNQHAADHRKHILAKREDGKFGKGPSHPDLEVKGKAEGMKRVRESDDKRFGNPAEDPVAPKFQARGKRVLVKLGKFLKKIESLQKLKEKVYEMKAEEESDQEEIQMK